MVDSDLAILYGCANGTKTINQAVKRSIERFPSNFYFQLTKEEYDNLKSQIGTSNDNFYGEIGKKVFAINKLNDKHYLKLLISMIKCNVGDTNENY